MPDEAQVPRGSLRLCNDSSWPEVPTLRRFLGGPPHKIERPLLCDDHRRKCCALQINVNDQIFGHLFFDNQRPLPRSPRSS